MYIELFFKNIKIDPIHNAKKNNGVLINTNGQVNRNIFFSSCTEKTYELIIYFMYCILLDIRVVKTYFVMFIQN